MGDVTKEACSGVDFKLLVPSVLPRHYSSVEVVWLSWIQRPRKLKEPFRDIFFFNTIFVTARLIRYFQPISAVVPLPELVSFKSDSPLYVCTNRNPVQGTINFVGTIFSWKGRPRTMAGSRTMTDNRVSEADWRIGDENRCFCDPVFCLALVARSSVQRMFHSFS